MTWLRLEVRRRWRSLLVLALLVALATGTVLAAAAGARRGQSAFDRLWTSTLPATVTVLPNQPGFDWDKIRALPEVAALSEFPVNGTPFVLTCCPDTSVGFPPIGDEMARTIERPAVLPSPALFDRYRASILGTNGHMYINALIRLKGGAAAIPAFRADLARVTGRSDIDVWNNREFFGGAIVRITRYEAASLLAFALAALVAALFLIGQSVARYTSATVADLQVLQAVGMTPRQAVASATAPPLLAAAAGATLGVASAIVASRWMPIGGASYQEPHPGVSADWLILGPGWVLAPVLVAAGSAAAAALAR